MANTLKFGDGKWATGEGTALAFNDENDNFKPLPFTFTRNSSATVVNQSGLIEEVGSDVPRIDFKDNTKGALLLEPSRTNLVTNTTDFFVTGWSGTRITEGSTIISPDGTNIAHKLIASTDDNTHYRKYDVSSASAGTWSGSCFFKKDEHTIGGISTWSDGGTNRYVVYVDLEDGRFIETQTKGTPTGTSYKIEDYGSEWYRITTTITNTSGYVRIIPFIAKDDYSHSINSALPVFEGSGTDGGYAWGAQLELGSYSTSYIPTQGSSVTRVADTDTKQVVTNSVIGQTEGTIFYDIDLKNITTSSQYVGALSDGSSSNRIQFLNNSSQQWQLFISASTISSNINLTTNTSGVGRYKIAIAYESGNVAYYINGVQKGTSSETFTFSNLLHFDLGQRYDDDFYLFNPIIEAKLYNTRLSNSELATLTQV